jgi:hypothetical protein
MSDRKHVKISVHYKYIVFTKNGHRDDDDDDNCDGGGGGD